MAERFNLTAQIQLQAPRNTSNIVGDIRKQLSGITANVKVKGDARTLAQINKQMQGVDKAASSSAKSVGRLNRNLSEAARRFSVITVATGTMLALARAIKNAVGEAIAFERELIKISQVTGKTVQNLQDLTQEVTRLSTVWGASSKELLNVSRVLAQAGFSAEKTRQALDILAKTSLGATFNSLTDTTEGAIAVLRQFRNEAKAAGGDIKFLEQTMDAINSVSKKFAVESGDLITVIRRVGGVFEAAGGSVNELIALFTSVRATTRESAETIATGLRTIFTRIQRTDTVDQLAALGIQLRDSQGQFVGAYEAVSRLSQGLKGLNPRDFRFSEIVESLGGFRQIGKVIPLIRQFTTAQDALNVAQSSSGSVSRDAETAQKSLAIQAKKVREEFSAMIREFADSSTFRSVAKGALEMASAFIRIAEALEPLLPLIASLIALKIGRALGPGLGALVGIGGKRKAAGGRIQGYARGGFVPGKGNRDTVPAMLTPGEFVIKKSSAKKLGTGQLESMNKMGTGGPVGPNDFKSRFNRTRVVREEH
ncbi:MAG TPA: phage tail tape measure protein, partial [Flavobacteriales bacterium]|nr:phage tail tape measure protein [Flavobacteriales bacterium]